MDTFNIRPKRAGKRQWQWKEKIYVPCPLPVKNKFTEVARLNGMSQAELGAVIVECVLASPLVLQLALNQYERKEASNVDWAKRTRNAG